MAAGPWRRDVGFAYVGEVLIGYGWYRFILIYLCFCISLLFLLPNLWPALCAESTLDERSGRLEVLSCRPLSVVLLLVCCLSCLPLSCSLSDITLSSFEPGCIVSVRFETHDGLRDGQLRRCVAHRFSAGSRIREAFRCGRSICVPCCLSSCTSAAFSSWTSLLLPNAAIAGSRAQSFNTVLTLPPKRLRCGFVSRLTLSLSTANAAEVSSSPTETSSLFMPQGTCCKTRQ